MTEKLSGKKFISKALYGSIIMLAVLLSFQGHAPSAWNGALLLCGTALSVALAEAFSETIAQVIAGKRKLDKEELQLIWHETRPILLVASLPAIPLLLSAVGLFAMGTAIVIAEILIYGMLFLSGLRIGYLLHGPTMRVILAGLFTLGIGGLLGFIKLLFH